jgi:ATP-dependent DNA helicase RecG
MLKLSSPVSSIPKVGPKYKTLLEKLGIFSVEDILYHFPFRYDDFSTLKTISELEEGDTVTVEATLTDIKNIYTKYRKRLTTGKIEDKTGVFTIIWFNQHYITNTLKTGFSYKLSGKVGVFNNKPCFIGPEIEPANSKQLNTARLVPVYPETAGISSKWLRTRINDVLNGGDELEEFLPDTTLNNHKLKGFDTSLREFHFPTNLMEVRHAKQRFGFEELFMELLKVENRKHEWKKELQGIPMNEQKYNEAIEKLIKSLPFKLTDSQEEAVNEILDDMSEQHPMNRLLEGDVGTGKTIVAIIAAYFSYINGYKTVYMAPTEILANQHYESFNKFLGGLGIKIVLITGNTKPSENNWDIIIGTHALLFNKDGFDKTGLIVIDEQHRFGVEQRTKLIDMSKGNAVPHFLTMTATPIPRTLALTLFGDLSISTLKTPPNLNKKITTKVIPEKQRIETYEHIKDRGEPTFIVCPLIEESESTSLENVKAAEAEYESLKSGVFKGVPMGLLHGRMRPKEKQEIVEKFKSGKIKILVSTPVIEVGIDIPEATIMVIESAERYGLASLHQLRGRVGRGDKPGFCLVFMSNNSRNSYSRLKNLERINNGLELAELDLKIRGQGDIYGTMQHGFKRFKVADLNDLSLLEKAKQEARIIFPQLSEYPKLEEKLKFRGGVFVGKN